MMAGGERGVLDPFLHTAPDWVTEPGPLAEVVLSSRVRLARNLSSLPFPSMSTGEQQSLVANRVRTAAEHIANLSDAIYYDVESLTPEEAEFLVERRLVSRDLVQGNRHRGVLVNPGESLSIMVNEEDHLRLQGVVSGFRLGEALDRAASVDDALDAHLEYAFSPTFGYLTACPTNVGTGIRVSVLVHLAGLSLTGEARPVMQGATALGLAVRGFYGEGTRVMGNFVQISNHATLGMDENRIVTLLGEKVHRILESEQKARDTIWASARSQIEDKVYRAYGILTQARSIKGSEVLNLASAVRFGLALELPGLCSPEVLNEILVFSQENHLTAIEGRSMPPEQRRVRRAELIRGRLKRFERAAAPAAGGNGGAAPTGRGNRR